MPALGAAVDANANVFEFGVPITIPADYPARYTVDAETVYVTGGSGTRFLQVRRGQEDTLPASHAVNAAFTSAPAGSGTAQTVSLLGPFHVAHSDAGISVNGIAVASGLAAGSTILAAQIVTTETWDGITDQLFTFDVGLNGGSVPDGNYQMAFETRTLNRLESGSVSVFGGTTQTEQFEVHKDCRLDEEGMVVVFFGYGAGDPPTTGESDIYVLIATPA